ncbi:MAG TPA: ribose 5-phosphate isomerase B [Bacteroidales bacterium]|nr:ribose 5-phosphate isomerase B [Bacteroidales bacterium]HOK99175.1 ribose 5-phosphate isomerase B [Bacteroidales bacterium]HPO65042.1 ribose 5-phosphate isomerase B [Bacteroidales bacterium]
MKKIGIASDHAGFRMKEVVKDWLKGKDYEVVDFGTFSEESTDYPDYAHKLAEAVEKKEVEVGISLCGSGNGINMTVNKHQGIRAALCWNNEISRLARAHNDANICSLPARFISDEEAKQIVETFLNTGFDGGRHLTRINKIPLKIC